MQPGRVLATISFCCALLALSSGQRRIKRQSTASENSFGPNYVNVSHLEALEAKLAYMIQINFLELEKKTGASLQRQITESEKKTEDSLQHQIIELEKKIEASLQRQITKDASLQLQITELEKTSASLQHQITELEQTNASLQRCITELKKTNASLQHQFTKLEKTDASLQLCFTELEKTNASLQHQFTELEKTDASLQLQITKIGEKKCDGSLEDKAKTTLNHTDADNNGGGTTLSLLQLNPLRRLARTLLKRWRHLSMSHGAGHPADRVNSTEEPNTTEDPQYTSERPKYTTGHVTEVSPGGKFVFLVENGKDWEHAREECKRRGGDLATHLTKEELDFVWSELIPNAFGANDWVWIGGRVNAHATQANYEEKFEWIDGDPISAEDGLWSIRSAILQYKCMTIVRGNDYERKDGTRGHIFATFPCRYPLPFLCKI